MVQDAPINYLNLYIYIINMAGLKAYEVLAYLKTRQNPKQIFTTIISADNEKAAQEKIFALIGSRHKLARRFINIQKIQKLNDGQSRRHSENLVRQLPSSLERS